MHNLSTTRIPTDHKEAALYPCWKHAMDSEIQAL